MVDLVFFLAATAFTGGVGVAVFTSMRRAEKRFFEDAKPFTDVEAFQRGWGVRGVSTTQLDPSGFAVMAGGGKNNPVRWDCTSSVHRLAVRTTLHVDREGTLGKLREKLGKEDVHTGDAAFDAEFCLRGLDQDVVRGVFQRPGVQQAVRTLFADPQFRWFRLDQAGVLYAWCQRGDSTARTARDKALAIARLARVLTDAAEAEPVPAPTSPLRTSGVGGASGAPVGIPIGERR